MTKTRIDAMTGRRYQACQNPGCITVMNEALANGYCTACQVWVNSPDDVDAWAHDWRMEQLEEQREQTFEEA